MKESRAGVTQGSVRVYFVVAIHLWHTLSNIITTFADDTAIIANKQQGSVNQINNLNKRHCLSHSLGVINNDSPNMWTLGHAGFLTIPTQSQVIVHVSSM